MKRHVAIALFAMTMSACADGTSTGEPRAVNHAPIIDGVQAEPAEVSPNHSTQVSVKAIDVDKDELIYTWRAPEGWTISGDGGAITVTAPDVYEAHASVEVSVDDGHGATAKAVVELTTAKNRAPLISDVTAAASPVAPGGTTTLTVAADDPDGDALSYKWRAPAGWTLGSPTGRQVELRAPADPKASAVVEVTADDGHGLRTSAPLLVRTTDAALPTISALTAKPRRVAKGQTIELAAAVNAPGGAADELTYEWSVRDPAWTLTASNANAQLVAPNKPGQSTTVDLKVSGPHGENAMASVVVATLDNRAPTVSSLTAVPPQTAAAGLIQLAASARDPDADALTYHWSTPPGWVLTDTGSSAQLTAPDAHGQTATVELTVDDGFGGSTHSQIVVSTSANDPPIISSLGAAPRLIDAGGTTTLKVVAADPNGDALTYAWRAPAGWTLTGTGEEVSVTAPNQKSSTGTIEVVVDDGHGQSATSQTVVTTRDNRAPFITALAADPPTVGLGQTTQVAVAATDPDGDPLTYTWRVPSGWIGSSDGAQITLTAPTTYSTSADVMVRVSDGAYTASEFVTVHTVDNADDPSASPRTKMMVCGSHKRDTTVFIPEDSGLTEVSGCTPEASVKALLVTRSGAAAIDAAALKSYVSNGGTVITEHGSSAAVFNALFDAGVTKGTAYGACHDRIATIVRFSATDPFWKATSFHPMTLGDTGCGFSVDAYPGITALAGWSKSSVSLAYRDLGQGRLWLVEDDWQDDENYSLGPTIAMMRYMVGW